MTHNYLNDINEIMKSTSKSIHFDENKVLHDLKHYLPAQAPLKDFIHHNTLHAFQHEKFFDGTRHASEMLGYKVSLSLEEYRKLYAENRISNEAIEKTITEEYGTADLGIWKKKMLEEKYKHPELPRIGMLRANWKKHYKIDLDSLVQPTMFRIVCSYLDQGISIWNFPLWEKGFLTSIREMEKNSLFGFFKNDRAKKLLIDGRVELEQLLKILVGDEKYYEQYLFDQQFSHQGWSGMVAAVEQQPETLLDKKNITLHDFILFELLLEIDALDTHFGKVWAPLAIQMGHPPKSLFAETPETELTKVTVLWQKAFERTYYNRVLSGLKYQNKDNGMKTEKSFQAAFCIDDRECSFRRYIEKEAPDCETFGTPGFFGVEFFFQPQNGKFYTKLCPAPVTPKYLIKEIGKGGKLKTEAHFSKHSHNFYTGWLITQTLGFWSAFKLFLNIFRPTMSPATASSFRHMDANANLTIEHQHGAATENGLQIGYTIEEMVTRVEGVLKSIGLVKDFASLVYIVGHGSSSVNNPHFAAYDCGACSGRAGSVNARVLCHMANHKEVRQALALRGITIPDSTQFVGGLHDTTRDEIIFFDLNALSASNVEAHANYRKVFDKALDNNSKERSRRFYSIATEQSAERIHKKIKTRSVSLFEPRPELNHATNSLCIVGRRELTKGLFLDRRSFLNSYDYRVDPEGKFLLNILKAAAPVCGGINLEYYFSRVDNQKLGAGTKLPHNVMGLIGVANGIDGDLRPGLPSQMIEVHDPVRLLIIVEHLPEVVLNTIKQNEATYEWFKNEWVNLAVVNPETNDVFIFQNGSLVPYDFIPEEIETPSDLNQILEKEHENIPVYHIHN